jgi:exopolysaccharide production protein ExoQ
MSSARNSAQAGGPPGIGRIRERAEPFTPRRREPAPKRASFARDEDNLEPGVAFRLAGATVDADGAFAFALFLAMLFIAQLGTIGGAIVAALTPIYVYVRRERLLRVMAPRAFLFAIPAFAYVSVLWSQAPGATLRAATELLLTITAGLLLSSARSQVAVLRGLAGAFFVYIVVALAFGGRVAIGVGIGGDAFSGLSASKNLLADIASSGLIVSTVVGMMALQRRNWFWALLAVFAIALDLYAVIGARSAGALLGLGMGVAAMLALTPLVYAGKAIRGLVTSIVAVLLLAGGLSYRWLATNMIEMGATLFDKDPTLTGRTYLWYRADDLIREKPMLGRGYNAFWQQGNTDAEGLWQYFGIYNRSGFTFHNTLVDVLVTMGWIGAGVFVATMLIGVVTLIRRFVMRPNLSQVFWISILLYQLARTPIETIGVAPFYFSTALCFAALGASFGRVKTAPADQTGRVPHQPIRELRAWTVEPTAGGRVNPRHSLRLRP